MRDGNVLVMCVGIALFAGLGGFIYGAEESGKKTRQETIAAIEGGGVPVSSDRDAPYVTYSQSKGGDHGWALRCPDWKPIEIKGGTELRRDRTHYIICPVD